MAQNRNKHDHYGGFDAMMLPMLVMMGMCVVVFALAVVIPALGTGLGIAVAVLAGALMLLGHRKLMHY